MNWRHASRNPGRFAVDYGHQIEEAHCPDEAELREQQILVGGSPCGGRTPAGKLSTEIF